jgi:hypothetical protein
VAEKIFSIVTSAAVASAWAKKITMYASPKNSNKIAQFA